METPTESSKPPKNILDLPTEVLEHVFSFLPTLGNASLVCRRFYGVSQRIPRELNLSLLETLIVDEIMSIHKMFDSIFFWKPSPGDFGHAKYISEELTRNLFGVLSKIGEGVKSLTFERVIVSETFDFHSLFQLLPNLERLTWSRPALTVNRHLNTEPINTNLFPKLKRLRLMSCLPFELKLFGNFISTTALTSLEICCPRFFYRDHENEGIQRENVIRMSRQSSEFDSRHKAIETLHLCSCYKDLYDFERLESLTTFKCIVHLRDTSEIISKRWPSLVILELRLELGSKFLLNVKLPNSLRTLSIWWNRTCRGELEMCLDRISSPNLKTLILGQDYFYRDEFRFSIAAPTLIAEKFPRLESLEFNMHTNGTFVNKIIESCQSVKTLTLMKITGPSPSWFSPVKNDSLIMLKETHDLSFRLLDIAPFGSCKNLKHLETASAIRSNILKDLLIAFPNLTTLKLLAPENEVSFSCVEILKAYGQNLDCFVCSGMGVGRIEGLTQEYIQQAFGHQFKNIKLDSHQALYRRCYEANEVYVPQSEDSVRTCFVWEMNNFSIGFTLKRLPDRQYRKFRFEEVEEEEEDFTCQLIDTKPPRIH